MRVLLTGATGFVGQEITKQLRAAGCELRVLVRNPGSESARALASRYGAETRAGDVTDAGSLAGALQGIHAIVHLVGIVSEAGKSTFEEVHTRGTANLVTAARRAGVGRFVHMSALGTRPGARSRYHQTKWAAEEAVRASGIAYTIFRPSLVYGPGDHFVNLFAKIARFSPVVPVIETRGARFQPVSVEAVTAGFVGALEEPRSVGQTYDLCGPERLTLSKIVDEVLAVLGRRRWKTRVPAGLARVQAALLEAIYPRLLGKAPPLNRDQLLMLSEDNVGDPRPADEMFRLKHLSFREGIERYIGFPIDSPGAGASISL